MRVGEAGPGEAHHYPILLRLKLPHVPCGGGEVPTVIAPSIAEGTLCTTAACTQRLSLTAKRMEPEWSLFMVPGPGSEDVHIFF